MTHKKDLFLFKLYLSTKYINSHNVTHNPIIIGSNNYLFSEQIVNQKILTKDGKYCEQNIHNYKLDNYLVRCFRKIMNNTYGCLPLMDIRIPILLNGDEDYILYNFCPDNFEISQNVSKIALKIMKSCTELRPPQCTFLYSNVYKTNIMKNTDKSTKMIYSVTSQVSYIEKYRMDYWELIYQLGGIVGVWFGWSALSVTSIAIYVKPFIKLLKCKSIYDIIIKNEI